MQEKGSTLNWKKGISTLPHGTHTTPRYGACISFGSGNNINPTEIAQKIKVRRIFLIAKEEVRENLSGQPGQGPEKMGCAFVSSYDAEYLKAYAREMGKRERKRERECVCVCMCM